jgi:site-specific DNA-cytosine methylase
VAVYPYLSLFAGAGGLDLSISLAFAYLGIGTPCCIGYVEIDAAAAGILVARIEDGSLDMAPVFSDVRTFPCGLYRGRVAGIIGGFPCTDLSVAGKRAGIHGEHSGLWFEYARIIREVRPEWVFIENVPAVINFPAGGIVLGELAALGFDAEWGTFTAAEVGAAHKRQRVFILAHRSGGGRPWVTPNARDSDKWNNRPEESTHQLNLSGQTSNWKTPHGMSGVDQTGKVGAGGEFAKQATTWMTPEAKNQDGYQIVNGKRIPRLGSEAQNWPTPRGEDAEACGNPESRTHWGGGNAAVDDASGSRHPSRSDRANQTQEQAGGYANLTDDVMRFGTLPAPKTERQTDQRPSDDTEPKT